MYSGMLPVYKECGLTSHDVVLKLRKILKTKRIGHAGTLNPGVTGVLPVCIGNTTRVSGYVIGMGKAYEVTVSIGRSTATKDQTGDTLETKGIHSADFNKDDIDQLLESFKGIIEQIPPMYSSIKVNDKRLYEYAHNNETVKRPKRKVNIKDVGRISELDFKESECHFKIRVICGKGTYIRTLAIGIDMKLGFPAHMSKLTRIESDGFVLKDNLTLEQIKELHEQNSLQNKLLPLEYELKGLSSIKIKDSHIEKRILNEQKFNKNESDNKIKGQIVFIGDDLERVLTIYIVHPTKESEIKPKKVFN